MLKISRRETAAPGNEPDAELLRDVGDWQELEKKILASLVERQKRINRQPERFRRSGVDPRGWQQHTKDFPESSIARLREHEPHYLRAGVGEMADKLDALWGEQDPITKRLLDARPVTLAGALSLASTWVSILGEREDSVDDWLLKITNAAERSLVDVARLAENGAMTAPEIAGEDPFEALAAEWAAQKAECERITRARKEADDKLDGWARDRVEKGRWDPKTCDFIPFPWTDELRDLDERIKTAQDEAGLPKLDAESDAAYKRLGDIEKRISETPTTTLLGIAAKLRVEAASDVEYETTTSENIMKTALAGAEHLLAESEKAV